MIRKIRCPRMGGLALLAVVGCVGCVGSNARREPSPPSMLTAKYPPPTDAQEPSAPSQATPLALERSELQRWFCPNATQACQVEEVLEAGHGAQAQPLWLVHIAIGARNLEDVRKAGGTCVRDDWWLVAGRGHNRTRRLIAKHCNDGYGAAGVGANRYEVGDNWFRHGAHGGSAWRWTQSETFSLDPLQLLEVSSMSEHTVSYYGNQHAWNWRSFSGKGVRTLATNCNGEEAAETVEARYLDIPLVQHDAGDHMWAAFDFGLCAATVDSSGKRGFVVHGKSGDAGDASMEVFANGNGLFVRVVDDEFVTDADSWLFEDHLEVWTTEDDHECIDSGRTARQYIVPVRTTRPLPAFREPTYPLIVDRLVRPGEVRFALRFVPELPKRLTLVYSDSDDGRTQERLIATSQLKFGVAATVGDVHEVQHSRCVLVDNRLVPESTWKPPPPEQPLLANP